MSPANSDAAPHADRLSRTIKRDMNPLELDVRTSMKVFLTEREGRVRRLAVGLWVVSIFFNSSTSIGPVERVRLSDGASAILILVLVGAYRRKVVIWPLSGLAILAMAAVGLFFVPFAQDSSLAMLGSVQLCEIGLVVVALTSILRVAPESERVAYVGIFLTVAGLESIVAVLQSLTRAGPLGEPTRGVGTLDLALAFFVSVAWIYAVWKAVCVRGRVRLQWLILVGVLSAGLVASQTRTSWLAALAAVVLMVFLWRPRVGAIAVAGVIVGALAVSQLANVLNVHSGPLERVDSLVSLAHGDTSSSWTLTKARIAYWHASIDTIQRHPFGIGLKNFRLTLPALTRRYLAPKYASAYDVESPHNQFLFTAVELGPLGLLLLLVVYARAATIAFSAKGVARLLALPLLLLVTIQLALSDVLFGPLGMLFAALIATAEWYAWPRRKSSVTEVQGL